MTEQTTEINALCQCDYYNLTALHNYFSINHSVHKLKNVVTFTWDDGEAFIFDYGVTVFWGVQQSERDHLLALLDEFSHQPLENMSHDEFTYEQNAAVTSLKNDHICLPSNEVLLRMAVSHGIAQSTKLMQYEARVQNTINSTEHIPKTIAKTGTSGLKRKALAKLRGQLYLTKSDVMLHYDLLDVPEFFWEHPELQHYYTMLSDYLEIKPRIEVLNKKLATIQDLLGMIADEQKHSHSSMLEWIIIWLIAIEMLILILQEFV